MEYNIQYETENITFVKGDAVNISWTAKKYNNTTLLWDDFDLTGLDIDIDIKTMQGTLIKSWSTASEITVAGAVMTVTDSAFTDTGRFKYDVQVEGQGTFRRGKIYVVEEITT